MPIFRPAMQDFFRAVMGPFRNSWETLSTENLIISRNFSAGLSYKHIRDSCTVLSVLSFRVNIEEISQKQMKKVRICHLGSCFKQFSKHWSS